MIYYLIGTNHAHQLEGHKDGNSVALGEYLSAFCSDNGVDLLAEELNEEAVAKWKADGSVAKSVASRLSISHLYCDPNLEERQRLGTLTHSEAAKKLGFGSYWAREKDALVEAEVRKTWPARESFWLEKLRQVMFTRCVFVLGAKHVVTFGDLLASQGIAVHVAQSDWKP